MSTPAILNQLVFNNFKDTIKKYGDKENFQKSGRMGLIDSIKIYLIESMRKYCIDSII
jgi:hypothetical protein